MDRTISFGNIFGLSEISFFDNEKSPLMGIHGTADDYGFTSMGWMYYDTVCDGSDATSDQSSDELRDASEKFLQIDDLIVEEESSIALIIIIIAVAGCLAIIGVIYMKQKKKLKARN